MSSAPKYSAPPPPLFFLFEYKLGAKSILPSAVHRAARHALLSFEPHLLRNKELQLIYKNILDAVFSSSGFLLSSCPPRLTQVSKNSLHLIRVSLVMIWQALLELRRVPGEPVPLSTSGSLLRSAGSVRVTELGLAGDVC